MAVHVYGTCAIIDDEEELADALTNLVLFYEPDSTLSGQSNRTFYRNMMKAIVGFRIEISDVQGAAKLSQNKPADAQARVISHLRDTDDAGAQGVAKYMQRLLTD